MGTVRARELNTIQRKSPETVSRTSTRQKSPETRPETGAIRQLETGRAGPQSSTLKKITGLHAGVSARHGSRAEWPGTGVLDLTLVLIEHEPALSKSKGKLLRV
jgi:hypothetical protein